MPIETIVSMPFDENTYVLWRDGSADALVVDPGLEPAAILSFLNDRKLVPVAILNTHGHADHIAGNGEMKRAYPDAPLVIGAGDAHLLTDAWANLSAQFGMPIVSPKADRLVRDGEEIAFAGYKFLVREIPGHSPGHVVFIADDFVLGGDVLFQGSVGRTDFPGGSFETLEKGIREKLYTLPDETVIYPGHGPTTTVGREKRLNEFVRAV